MSQPHDVCAQCGATGLEWLCKYCGLPSNALLATHDVPTQLEALRTLHAAIRQATKEDQIRLLEAGYLPEEKAVLVEAGLMCYPLIKDGDVDDVSSAAVRRLEMIVGRIKIFSTQPEYNQALKELESRLQRHRRADWRLGILSVAGVVVLLVLLVLLVSVLLRRCGH